MRWRPSLAPRDVIGMAKGIVMQWAQVDEAAALRLLVKTSQDINRELRDVAQELISTGAMPKRRAEPQILFSASGSPNPGDWFP
jgi:AmiR/NasT family two-component response regulator